MAQSACELFSLCEPFFAEVCALRLESSPSSAAAASGRVLAALTSAAQKSRLNPSLEQSFARIRADLVFFADYALSGRIPGWRSLAEEQLGIVTGEELFCRDLESALEDERADEAEVFRVCIGLGFSGAEAVGAERWRRAADTLSRLVPVARPDGVEAANPSPAPSRSGPMRRTPWTAVLFLTLAAALAGLTIWQILRAPVDYRERMARLRSAASAPGKSAVKLHADGEAR